MVPSVCIAVILQRVSWDRRFGILVQWTLPSVLFAVIRRHFPLVQIISQDTKAMPMSAAPSHLRFCSDFAEDSFRTFQSTGVLTFPPAVFVVVLTTIVEPISKDLNSRRMHRFFVCTQKTYGLLLISSPPFPYLSSSSTVFFERVVWVRKFDGLVYSLSPLSSSDSSSNALQTFIFPFSRVLATGVLETQV
jgi:hypothetical protein